MEKFVQALPATASIETRARALDWPTLFASLNSHGWAAVQGLFSPAECRALVTSYDDERLFRSRIVLERHGFGRGEYKNFSYPLPDAVARVRAAFYPELVPIANQWNESLGVDVRFPSEHADFIRRGRTEGRVRPAPMLVRYGPGDYYCLRQDASGENCFPFKIAILLNEPQTDFTGGEFAFSEQQRQGRARLQVVPLRRGDAVVFAARYRPVDGRSRNSKVNVLHGTSTLRSGQRHTLGIRFHDST